ncbi:PTS sugar transporter subunit IIA [Spirochaeta dissipatitropha]
MSIAEYLSPDRIILLKRSTKEGAVLELVKALCASLPGLDQDQISTAIWEREQLMSTRISPLIAVPHAQLPGVEGSYIAVGKSRRGLIYDARDDQRVHLVFLLVGSEENHLKVLSELARLLQRQGLVQRLLAAAGRRQMFQILTETPPRDQAASKSRTATVMGEYAGQLAERVHARVVMVHGESASSGLLANLRRQGRTVVLVGSEDVGDDIDASLYDHHLLVPFKGLNRSNQVEITMLMALSRGLIHKGDKVVNVFGLTGDQLDTIVLSDVARDFKLFFSMPASGKTEGLDQQVFMRAMQIMAELAQEGREGKSVGTLIVLGDYEHVKKHCQQMVINPFQGYDESERNILDPSITETIKEFSRIDGAFVIRGDGVIMSAGTYLRIDNNVTGLTPGLGARHTAAAGITLDCEALSICLSESTRQISLFRSGERIMIV